MEWLKNFIIPLIEIIFLGGIGLFILFYVGRAVWNAWSKSFKFTWKYSIRRNLYPETTVKWIIDCIDKGIGYYDAKKILMVKMYPDDQINETLWIYDKIIIELNNQGGLNKNGKQFKRDNSKDEGKSAEFPSI